MKLSTLLLGLVGTEVKGQRGFGLAELMAKFGPPVQTMFDLKNEAISDLQNSMEGFHDFIEDNFGDVFEAFVHDNPENEIGRRSRTMGGGATTGGLTEADKAFMMKYLQLKFVILFQQKNQFVGKYCFYGCWCFPQAAMFQWQGFGQPVDNIDRSCREYTTCFNCVYNQMLLGQRCNEWDMTHYNIQGVSDPNTGRVSLFCTDPIGSCLRSRCECDRDLSGKLSQYEHEWNQMNHHKWSNPLFNRQAVCTDPQAATSTAFLQAIGDGKFEVVKPFEGVPSLGGKMPNNKGGDGGGGFRPSTGAPDTSNQLSLTELATSNSQHAQQLYHLINSQLSHAEREYSMETGQVVIKIVREQAKSPKPPSAPIYGAIVGCCGRAPYVHYYRQGQRCCPDGQVVDARAPCDIEIMG